MSRVDQGFASLIPIEVPNRRRLTITPTGTRLRIDDFKRVMRWEKLLRGLIARVGRFDFVDLELSEFTTTFFISPCRIHVQHELDLEDDLHAAAIKAVEIVQQVLVTRSNELAMHYEQSLPGFPTPTSRWFGNENLPEPVCDFVDALLRLSAKSSENWDQVDEAKITRTFIPPPPPSNAIPASRRTSSNIWKPLELKGEITGIDENRPILDHHKLPAAVIAKVGDWVEWQSPRAAYGRRVIREVVEQLVLPLTALGEN